MDKSLEDSIKEAKDLMKLVPDAFHGGSRHVKKVVEIATQITKFVTEADQEVVLLAAWWHDTGRVYDPVHEKLSAKLAYKDLLKRGLSEKFCHAVYLAIAHHKWDMKPVTIEGVIIRDADKLALLDPKRWENAIKNKAYHKFEHTIHILEKMQNGEILQLDISQKIYKILLREFLEYIKNEEDEDFQTQKDEILNLYLKRKVLLK